jgi:predicted dehydrogenase
MNSSRRIFLAAAPAGALRSHNLASPNDRVRVACVGLRGMGRSHIGAYSKLPNVEIAALCDVDENVLDERLKGVEASGKARPARYTDFRKLLEDKSIDAVSIATPNFHHTLQAIWACQAGKDVYVEKPCSYNMFEARQIVAAAKKYGRMVQHGTNLRSDSAVREAVRQLRNGAIGDLYMGRSLIFKWRDTIGRAAQEPAPKGVHYDLWTGPAPEKPFTKNRFHYNWHWQWDYGNGDIGNQGIHHLDMVRWGLGVTYPTRVSAMGGHYMFDDDQETPNTMVATYEFAGADGKKKMLVCEVRHWISNKEGGIGGQGRAGNCCGHLFYGSNGYMAVEDSDYRSFLGKEQTPGPAGKGGGNNWANFLQCVRSRKWEELNAPIDEGAASTVLVHLANIAYRLGRTLNFNAEKWECTGDAEATRMFTRPHYRKPFVVPEKV